MELLRPVDRVPSSSSFGSFFMSGFFSSAGTDAEDEDVSMGSPLHPSSNGFSFFICANDSKHQKYFACQIILTYIDMYTVTGYHNIH